LSRHEKNGSVQINACTCTHACTPTMHAHVRAHARTCTRTMWHARTCTHMHARVRTRTRACTPMHAHSRTVTRARAHARACVHVRACIFMQCAPHVRRTCVHMRARACTCVHMRRTCVHVRACINLHTPILFVTGQIYIELILMKGACLVGWVWCACATHLADKPVKCAVSKSYFLRT
jgi:hypothetical protein